MKYKMDKNVKTSYEISNELLKKMTKEFANKKWIPFYEVVEMVEKIEKLLEEDGMTDIFKCKCERCSKFREIVNKLFQRYN